MKKNCILVVDDDKKYRDMIVDYLEEQGFSTLQAESGDIAFKHIEQIRPDLILLEILMHAGNGLEVCHKLKAEPSTSAIPVIIVSGSASLHDKLSGYFAGAMRYLAKPFELGELGECVSTVLYPQGVSE